MKNYNGEMPSQKGPGQTAAPELLCQQSRSLCESQCRQEHLDIHVVYKIAWSFLLGCQAKVDEENRRNWNVRYLHHFLLITNVYFACDLQRHGKGVGQPAPPGRTKRKKSHGFQLPGDDVCWQQQILINVYRGPAFRWTTSGDLEGKFPIKAKRKIT